jgi:adenylate cyclase
MGETRKIAAILAADMVGYSRLAGADEDRTLSRLRGLRSDLFDPAIAAHHGRIVKRTGDGSLIEFRSVVDAVRCAVEVQNGLIERNAGLPPERRIEFRVGIHLGDVVEESDGDLMGDGVNIAARLEGIAAPGAICLSEDAYRQVKGRLDLAVTDLGQTQLKNIAEPIRVYSLQVGVPAQAKPAPAAAPVTEPKPPASKERSFLAALALGIAGLLIVIAALAYFLGSRPPTVATNTSAPVASNAAAPTKAGPLSIVVLPFSNLSGDPSQDYLADALTDELTTGLTRFRDSFVIAHNTAATYKGKLIDAKAIGKDLGVRYVLEGSVQPSGSQVRVNAQLIDADTGAHLWADQFDTPRTDLLKMQDEIVTRLARALELQFVEAEAARAKRAPAANPDAQDLALQCWGIVQKGGYLGKEAEAGFPFCDKALAIDPNNVRALNIMSGKFWFPLGLGLSSDPKGDLKKADELVSRMLALDPNFASAHMTKARILDYQQRFDEAVTEDERALALDPALVDAVAGLAFDYQYLGQFEKSLEYFDKAIRLSPHDPYLSGWYGGKANEYLALKQYDQAIDWARQAIAINPNHVAFAHADLIAAFELTGREAEAREALQRYLALPVTGLKTIAAWKAYKAGFVNEHTDPRARDYWDLKIESLRKAGMPEDDGPRLSIVVLPFANLSGDASQDYLADALTDELTTALARVSGSFVIARNTAFTYKGKPTDAKAIGKDLGVRYVLEGSVQPSGAQVRVNAQLIDTDNGAHLWAEQFDTARVDLLQTQDEIVTHLARALELQLPEAEAARLKRTPAANPNAEDLALQCTAVLQKGGFIGKDAEAGFPLCEQALAVDPNNVRALGYLALKFWLPAAVGLSADPEADLKRGDELLSKALALDPNYAGAHMSKANILRLQGRRDEAIAENERAIALDPAMADAVESLGVDYMGLGQFDKSLEYLDKAIRLSPHDPNPGFWYDIKGVDYFGLKQYDQAVEWTRRSIAVNSNVNPRAHTALIAALALTGHDAEAREALQRYLAIPPTALKTIAAWRAYMMAHGTGPPYLEFSNRLIDGLRKAGMPEE